MTRVLMKCVGTCGKLFSPNEALITDGGVICRLCQAAAMREQNKRELEARFGDDDAGDRVIFPHADRK